MGARDETVDLLRQGFSPIEISRRRGVTLSTTLQYLDQFVGCGKLRRSEILATISVRIRRAVAKSPGKIPNGVDANAYEVVTRYGGLGYAYGEIYEDIRQIESLLHMLIRFKLEMVFGKKPKSWWREGVPQKIRVSCQTRMEEDIHPAKDPYNYTDLIDLGKIIEANWQIFQGSLPKPYPSNRKLLLEDFMRLNGIRNNVMHPVRNIVPKDEEFRFARQFMQGFVLDLIRNVLNENEGED